MAKFRDLQAELALLRMDVKERPRLVWDIDKFIKIRSKIIGGDKEREIYSEEFETYEDGYQMMLSLWPDGGVEGDDSRSTSVSVYALLRPGPCDSKLTWPPRLCIKICVEDPSNLGEHIIYKLDTTSEDEQGEWESPEGHSGRGKSDFINLNDLESYLENGSLRIIVAVSMYPDDD